MRINTNLTAQNTFTQYTKNNNKIASSVSKLSSGFAINNAADNAAGLAISEKMRAQIRGLSQASTNAQDAISLTQTAEGSLSESTEILQRMRELAVQSSNDTNNNAIDREALQDEFTQLQNELDEISKTTSFNKKTLLDGSLAKDSRSLSAANMANASMSVNLGKCAAGDYKFKAYVKEETAAIAGKKATTTASTSAAKLGVTDASTVTAEAAPATAQMNGNYALSAVVNDDSSITVTATGDNDQVYTATLSKDALTEALEGFYSPTATAQDTFDAGVTKYYSFDKSSGTYTEVSGVDVDTFDDKLEAAGGHLYVSANANPPAAETGPRTGATKALTLNFGNGGDTTAFTVALTCGDTTVADARANYTMQSSSLGILADDLKGITVSCAGGVDATDASYGVYASLTGAEDVKLEAGMDSVTFSNGITMNFDKLTETSLAVDATTTPANPTAPAIINNFGGATPSTFTVKREEGAGLTFQVGANKGDELVINIDKLDANYLGVASASISTREAAANAIKYVDDAINQVSSQRAYLGAIQNRLDHKIANLDTSNENLTAAESQIRDVDMAKEMTQFTNANILSQAATAMLAQANSLPQNVLSLIG